jgi:hypothetical protein
MLVVELVVRQLRLVLLVVLRVMGVVFQVLQLQLKLVMKVHL